MPSISQNQGQSSQSSFGKNLSSLLLQVPILIILVKNLVDTHFLGVLLLNLYAQWPEYKALECEDLFNKLKIEPGGYGISWNEDLDCSEGELYQKGVDVSLKLEILEPLRRTTSYRRTKLQAFSNAQSRI